LAQTALNFTRNASQQWMYSAKRRIEEQSHLDYAKAFPGLRAVAMKLISYSALP